MIPRPWLLYKLFVLAAVCVCGVLLSREFSTTVEARPDMRFYWALHYWECAFDAVSAATGCGLSTLRWSRDLTPAGRWIVLGTGLSTAIGYLIVLYSAVICSAGRLAMRPASAVLCLGGWYLVAAIALMVLSSMLRMDSALQAPWTVLFSLGTCRLSTSDPLIPWAVLSAGLSGGGVFVLLLLHPAVIPGITRRAALVPLFSYGLIVLFLAMLLSVFESSRGTDLERPYGRGGAPPTEASPRSEFVSAMSAIFAAQAGGVAIDPADGVPRRDAAKFVLGLGVLLGGMFGAPGGGVVVPLSLSLAFGLSRSRDAAKRWAAVARRTALFAFTATVVVALGLLFIEQKTASAFTPTPTFAGAWLDAASAIGGANLTGELTAAVTSRSLSSGIRTPSDQYQYGMVWLMGAMLAGKLAPLWFLYTGLRTAEKSERSSS